MPKRKRSEMESLDYIKKKIKKLERKLLKSKRRSSSDSESSVELQAEQTMVAEQTVETDIIADLLIDEPRPTTSTCHRESSQLREVAQTTEEDPEGEVLPEPETKLDEITLEILGENPLVTKTVGKDIQNDLAVRFEFIATSGLEKDLRKQLIESHLPPANCKLIDSPSLNPEIKAAVADLIQKRDKAMQVKQKELCSAISSLSEAITLLLAKESKDPVVLKLLMDTGRILCDCQYNDSVTRRNFILAALKKELKEQLRETKIDQLLFGQKLVDTIKSAKAISKSGAELKAAQPYKGPTNSQKPPPASFKKNLNWKAPSPSRRPTESVRAKEPAPQRSQHAPSSRASRPITSRSRRR